MKTAAHMVYQPRNMADPAAAEIGPLVLVNRQHPLEGGFTVPLMPPVEAYPDVLMERQAATMLAACLRAAGGDGVIVPVSGWRSHREQQKIWDDTLTAEGEAFTRQYVARPGCSEHETGLAIDLAQAAPEIDFIRPYFPYDGVCGTFRELAPRYGFIQRYRAHKAAVTGIAEEPWHFRYVGAPHARLMEENHLCLEEYGDFVRTKPRRCRLPDGKTATVTYLPCPGPAVELEEPQGCYQLSGDNDGGFFLTVWGNLL